MKITHNSSKIIRYALLLITFLIASPAVAYLDKFSGLKDGVYFNYVKIGYYHDGTANDMTDAQFSDHVKDFMEIGFDGVMFELTVGVNYEGFLLENLKYEKLERWIQIVKDNSLGVSILPNFTFNDDNAVYVNSETINFHLGISEIFSEENFLQSVKQYWNKNIGMFESLGVDLINIGLFDDLTFFRDENRSIWEDIFADVRSNFSGAVTITWNKWDKFQYSKAEDINIWDLADAISIWGKLYASDIPIYDKYEIQKKLWESPKNPTGFIKEYIEVSELYQKPLMIIENTFAIDQALDGGFDPTEDQLNNYEEALNYEMMDLKFEATIHHLNNHLSDYITSWTFGNWEAWGFTCCINWNSLDISQFPSKTRSIFSDLFADGEYIVSDKIEASPQAEIIYVPTDSETSWIVNTGGGADIIRLGNGDDQVLVPSLSGLKIDFKYQYWANAAEENYTLRFFLDELEVHSENLIIEGDSCIGEVMFPCWVRANPIVYLADTSDTGELKIQISNSFLKFDHLRVRSGEEERNLEIQSSYRPPAPNWAKDAWITDFATFEISGLSKSGKITIDGGGGHDSVSVPLAYMDLSDNFEISNIEEIKFTDGSYAFGSTAIKVSNLVGMLLGAELMADESVLGEVMNYLSNGNSFESLTWLASDYALGNGFSNDDLVEVLFLNILGRRPDSEELSVYSNSFGRDKNSQVQFVMSLTDYDLVSNALGNYYSSDVGLKFLPVE